MNLDSFEALVSKLIVLDFETYYAPDYTLSKLTTADYIRDSRYETIGVGALPPGGREPQWFEHAEFLEFAAQVRWENYLVLAHHAHFDGFILSHRYDIRPGFWLDTLSMGRARHGVEVGGSLGKLMKHYNVGTKGDEVVKALGKRRKDFTTEEWLRYGEYCKGDVMGTLGVFLRMLELDFPDSELGLIDTTVRMFTEPVLRLDEPKMRAYLSEEQARKAALVVNAQAEKSELMSNPKFAAQLLSRGVVPPTKISKTTGEETYAFAKSDPGMQALLEDEDPDVRALAEARVGVKSTINETRTERLLRLGRDGASLPVYLEYAGAHTHRWSGGDKLNWQNFQRGGVIRDAIWAPEGHVLVVVDSSQIEARVVAWLAEHTALLDAFAANRDIYSEFASTVYGTPVDRKRVVVVDGKETKPDFVRGFVGKVCILGLGYGMGWAKFAMTLQAGAMGGPRVTFTQSDADSMGVQVGHFARDPKRMRQVEEMPSLLPLEERVVHCAVAEFIVQRYRREHAPIPALWREMEQVVQGMSYEDADFPISRGNMRIVRHGLVLPNGLTLKYAGLEGDSDEGWSYVGSGYGKTRSRLYGGLMTENVTQALARIIVADQMQHLREEHGFRACMMTHDEVVLCVPEDRGEAALKTAIEVFRTPPAWAPDLPLNAEGGVAKSYGEAK